MSDDPHELRRFTEAQDDGATYARALAEVSAGRKVSHWMWFVFPQLAGLGHSPTARRYALASVAEARAYLQHPVLGPRLLEVTRAVAGLSGRSAQDIFGPTDALKLRSSMTLFALAAPDVPLFSEVLGQYFAGLGDPATVERV